MTETADATPTGPQAVVKAWAAVAGTDPGVAGAASHRPDVAREGGIDDEPTHA